MRRAGLLFRREARYFVELVGITAVAVAQPVFNVIEQAPEELVNRGAGAFEITVFAVALVIGPPTVLWLLEQPFRLVSARARDVAHGSFLGLGIGLFVVELVKSALGDDPRRWLWLVGIGVAVAAAVVLLRSDKAHAVLRYLALAAPVFLALFLFFSPVADLVVENAVEPVDVAVEDPVPVVLIALDELPLVSLLDGQGAIDADAFPAFADLAGESTWFRNTTGVSPVTPSALPAILTGQLPDETFPAPVSTRFNQSIFTLLGGTYDVEAVETLTEICPPTICVTTDAESTGQVLRSLFGLGRDVFTSLADPGEESTSLGFVIDRNPSDALAPQRFGDFGARVAAGQGATLDIGHFLLPHQPWNFLASGRTYDAPDPPRSAEFGDWHDDLTAAAGRQRHLVQLQYTDRLIGDAMALMEDSGRWDESLVIVTADHGVAFTGGEPLRGVSEGNYPQVMWTPMFVKLPGQTEGEVSDRPTESIDVVPTIADVLDVDVPWEIDGVSVFEDVDEDRPARMFEWRFNDLDADEDGFVVVDRDAGFAEVLAGANPMAGHADDPDALYRIGEYGDLVGTRVEDHDEGPPAEFAVTTYSRPTFAVAEGATDLPGYIEGLWADDPEPWVAAAVDGTIAGAAPAYHQGDFGTFWMLLPERLLTPGRHTLDLYAVSGPATDPALSPLEMVRRQD